MSKSRKHRCRECVHFGPIIIKEPPAIPPYTILGCQKKWVFVSEDDEACEHFKPWPERIRRYFKGGEKR